MDYEAVIGLEVHAQLKTDSKLFCSCSTRFGSPPNSQVCPVCSGMPGVLPVLNKKAVDYAIKMALATHCRINPANRFARKNYFYPDLPKAYQISQFAMPLAEHGQVNISTDGETKKIGITRIHMEEDAGKLLHEGGGTSQVDFNRCGVPLIEIVSEPDLRTSEEAKNYMVMLRDVLDYLEICDCNMEEGSLRCDANISLRPVGQEEFGTRAELKNMNSFRFLQKAIEYEIERQTQVLDDGGTVVQETRLWDEGRGITLSMRSKEEAHDYRYFPEPDLLPVEVDGEWVERLKGELPELPEEKRSRFTSQYSIPQYDAVVLTASKAMANYFETCAQIFPDTKTVSNWIMGELSRILNAEGIGIEKSPITPENLAGLLKEIKDGVISGKIAKTVFEEMANTGKDAKTVISEKGLQQIADPAAVEAIIDKVMEENPAQVAEYRGGKHKTFGFLVGQVMKASRGKANPQLVNELLKKKLSS
jgi:aspartyl-tRNA(Asn)/glutamyl-tRNA(Gln) amidotransferase subunit B